MSFCLSIWLEERKDAISSSAFDTLRSSEFPFKTRTLYILSLNAAMALSSTNKEKVEEANGNTLVRVSRP